MNRQISDLISNSLVLSESGVWTESSNHNFAYSDGAGPEAYIESVIASSRDLSSSSLELEKRAIDWASEYHLSRARAQLLKAFHFDSSSSVLEVGCGCGAITRYLGEKFREVVAVEGSSSRSRIARSRTRDLDNVAIVNARFQDLKFKRQFDYVFCIGVFEYSQMFVDAQDPYERILQVFDGFLTRDGTLVIAIENQFGLKYFSGSREDHTGIVYDGLEGYPRYEQKARTFGYRELKQRIERYFPSINFFFPFPDYKVPSCVLAEDFLTIPNVAELIACFPARDYPNGVRQHFDERLVLTELSRNRLIKYFGNSFLVLAKKTTSDVQEFPYLGVHYSGGRRPEFQTVTEYLKADDGGVVVSKRPLTQGIATDESHLQLHATKSEWIEGPSIQSSIAKRCMNRELGFSELFKPAEAWSRYIRDVAVLTSGGLSVPGDHVDCIWRNCFDLNGRVAFVDKEWEWQSSISTEVLAVRAIYRFLCDIQIVECIRRDLRNAYLFILIVKIGGILGFRIRLSHLVSFIEFESAFLSAAFGIPKGKLRRRLCLALVNHRLLAVCQSAKRLSDMVVRKLRYRRLLVFAR